MPRLFQGLPGLLALRPRDHEGDGKGEQQHDEQQKAQRGAHRARLRLHHVPRGQQRGLEERPAHHVLPRACEGLWKGLRDVLGAFEGTAPHRGGLQQAHAARGP